MGTPRHTQKSLPMRTLILITLAGLIVTTVAAGRTSAQQQFQRRMQQRPRYSPQHRMQSPPQNQRIFTDANGRQWVMSTVTRYVWDARTRTWRPQQQEAQLKSPGTIPINQGANRFQNQDQGATPLDGGGGAVVSGDSLFAGGGAPTNFNPPSPAPGGPPPAPPDLFAGNLGIYYQMIRYGDGTFGARLTRYPVPNSPAALLRLEPGDTIFALNSQRFTTTNDVLSHRNQTSVDFVNVRTNASQSANVNIR